MKFFPKLGACGLHKYAVLASLGIFLQVLYLPSAVLAQGSPREQVATQARLHAAYLLKFPNYVETLDSAKPRSGLVVGVVDADEVAEELEKITALANSTARPVIRRVKPGSALDGINLLYVGTSELGRHHELLSRASAGAVLVVSAADGALAHGSIINFRQVDDRVRFEISLPAAEKAQLRIGAPLLALAVMVVRGK